MFTEPFFSQEEPVVKTLASCLAAAMLAFAIPHAFAVDTPPDFGSAPRDPEYDAGKKAIDAKDWKSALEHFNRAASRDPRSADIKNMLGYVHRRSGNMELAFKLYDEALKLDPDHKGAHEYIGEAYLLAGNLPKAEEHLKALDRLCFFSCEEYRDLKRAVEDYRQTHK
jgi:Flp pilus assembly protein TadD